MPRLPGTARSRSATSRISSAGDAHPTTLRRSVSETRRRRVRKTKESLLSIRIQNLSGDKAYTVEVSSRATLADLRDRVYNKEARENTLLSLVLLGALLDPTKDGWTIEACGITNQSVVTLIRKGVPKIVTASHDQTARIWDGATGKCTHTLIGHSYSTWSVSFSPDSSHVLTASGDDTAKLWDCKTGECKQTFTGHSGPVKWAEFAPDG